MRCILIRTYAFVQPTEKPSAAQATLAGTLADAGVTGCNVTLQRVDVAGYAFAIDAEDAGDNLAILQSLCGSLNTVAAQGGGPPGAMLGVQAAARMGWDVAGGGEGRFAAEHPPPENSA